MGGGGIINGLGFKGPGQFWIPDDPLLQVEPHAHAPDPHHSAWKVRSCVAASLICKRLGN